MTYPYINVRTGRAAAVDKQYRNIVVYVSFTFVEFESVFKE